MQLCINRKIGFYLIIIFYIFFFGLDGSIVALKEIKLQPQEGLPFTAIRESSFLLIFIKKF